VGTSNVKFFVELAGAGAVLVGLIFVGLELRQNTAAVEASTLQNLTDASTEFVTNIGSDPNLTRIWITSSSDREKLTETEYAQLHLLIRGQWFRFQNAYLQWQRGTLSDEDWVLYEGFICRLRTEGPQNQNANDIRFTTWDDHKGVLLGQFVKFVESCRSVDYQPVE
jgi:hypothetical protein